MKRRLYSFLLLTGALTLAAPLPAIANNEYDTPTVNQDEEDYNDPLNIEIGARIDYQRDYRQGETFDDNSGFKGKYIMLSINGNISNRFSYAYRQRLNETKADKNFFDGTDNLYLQYRFNKNWDIKGGKMGLGIGSYEYERHPMEMYISSEFWNMIPCYKFGVSLGYNFSDKDRLSAQFTESPFKKPGMDLYSYNIFWNGHHDWFNTIYSANMLEYQPGKFIYYLALGHRLEFNKVVVELDYMNRATDNHAFFFKDCSLIGELSVQPTEHWNVFAKASYSRNVTDDTADECVWAGTDMTQVGGGFEFFPLKNGNRALRMHAAYAYQFGKNGNPNGALHKDQHFLTLGLQWRMDLIDLTRKVIHKAQRKSQI